MLNSREPAALRSARQDGLAGVADGAVDRGPRAEILTPDEVARNPALRAEWQRRAETSPNIYRLYHSPIWWDHLCATRGADAIRLVLVSESDGRISAIVPCELRTHRITRHVAGRAIALGQGRGFDLLASEPLADDRPEVFEAIVRGLWQAFPGDRYLPPEESVDVDPVLAFSDRPAAAGRVGHRRQRRRAPRLLQHPSAERLDRLSDPLQFEAAQRSAAQAAAPVTESRQPRLRSGA